MQFHAACLKSTPKMMPGSSKIFLNFNQTVWQLPQDSNIDSYSKISDLKVFQTRIIRHGHFLVQKLHKAVKILFSHTPLSAALLGYGHVCNKSNG
jgi:hypothetical protein